MAICSGFSHGKWWFSIYSYVKLPEGKSRRLILQSFKAWAMNRHFSPVASHATGHGSSSVRPCLGFSGIEVAIDWWRISQPCLDFCRVTILPMCLPILGHWVLLRCLHWGHWDAFSVVRVYHFVSCFDFWSTMIKCIKSDALTFCCVLEKVEVKGYSASRGCSSWYCRDLLVKTF